MVRHSNQVSGRITKAVARKILETNTREFYGLGSA